VRTMKCPPACTLLLVLAICTLPAESEPSTNIDDPDEFPTINVPATLADPLTFKCPLPPTTLKLLLPTVKFAAVKLPCALTYTVPDDPLGDATLISPVVATPPFCTVSMPDPLVPMVSV